VQGAYEVDDGDTVRTGDSKSGDRADSESRP
jgi:hypothetical protein